jgi:hypothetical protein
MFSPKPPTFFGSALLYYVIDGIPEANGPGFLYVTVSKGLRATVASP